MAIRVNFADIDALQVACDSMFLVSRSQFEAGLDNGAAFSAYVTLSTALIRARQNNSRDARRGYVK